MLKCKKNYRVECRRKLSLKNDDIIRGIQAKTQVHACISIYAVKKKIEQTIGKQTKPNFCLTLFLIDPL